MNVIPESELEELQSAEVVQVGLSRKGKVGIFGVAHRDRRVLEAFIKRFVDTGLAGSLTVRRNSCFRRNRAIVTDVPLAVVKSNRTSNRR